MDTYKLKWTQLQNRIFRFLSTNSGKSFNMRTLASELKVSPTAISKSLLLLRKEEIILYNKDSKMNLVSVELNREDSKITGLKRADNLSFLYESGLIDHLYESLPGATIILFGSFSLGEDVYNSDIDIAVFGIKEKDLDLTIFEGLLKKEIVLNFYADFDIRIELRNNILNGILLKGSVDL